MLSILSVANMKASAPVGFAAQETVIASDLEDTDDALLEHESKPRNGIKLYFE